MKLAIYIIITRLFKKADNKFRLILLVNLNITKYKIAEVNNITLLTCPIVLFCFTYTKTMYATNQILYATIASNYDEPLTYRQAVRLVKLEDVETIVNFVIKNTPDINKKTQTNNTGHRM